VGEELTQEAFARLIERRQKVQSPPAHRQGTVVKLARSRIRRAVMARRHPRGRPRLRLAASQVLVTPPCAGAQLSVSLDAPLQAPVCPQGIVVSPVVPGSSGVSYGSSPGAQLALVSGPYGFLVPEGWQESPLTNSGGPASFASFTSPTSGTIKYEVSGGRASGSRSRSRTSPRRR
jgi:hypothetical protein